MKLGCRIIFVFCVLACASRSAGADEVGFIDAYVAAQQKVTGFQPADVSTDSVFIRRVFLDVIGTLPTADEVRTFLADQRPDKRAKLIDRLLERPEFAEYLALKWGDLLRVKSEFPSNLWPNAVHAYHAWIRDAFRRNMPYDQFARALLTTSGSNFRDPPVNFYRPFQERTPRKILETAALVFMGVRLENAGWSAEERLGMDAFFAKAIVNRIWFWLLGRGIIHEVDDIRPDSRPWSPTLLAYLEAELITSGYDLKHIYRLILNSATYQRSSVATPANAGDEAGFSHYRIGRLDAEVLIDAICRITGAQEQYSSAIPEPFTFIPPTQRTLGLADGSIKSSFLEMFGRPGRDRSLASDRNTKYSLLRGMTHGINGHETASYVVLTGTRTADGSVSPAVGSVISYMKGYRAGYQGLIPPYVALTKPQGRFSEAGFLGSTFQPFATGGDPAKTPFTVEGVVAPGISDDRQHSRRSLLDRLDTFAQSMEGHSLVEQMRKHREDAYDLILGEAKNTFDLSKEPEALRTAYGKSTFGQSCLQARKLVEAGVPFITINAQGWDTHKKHFEMMGKMLTELDHGLSTLLQDLSDRGLLDSTIVWCGGEFGRTPKIDWEAPWNGGLGHYGKAFTHLVAGGGFKGGHVVG